jgi:hypothetical protein
MGSGLASIGTVKSVGFFALTDTDESAATKKLIAIRPRMLSG